MASGPHNCITNLSLLLVRCVCIKALGTLQIAMSWPSCALMTVVKRTDSRDVVGDVASSLGMYPHCLSMPATILSLIVASHLSFKKQMRFNGSLHLFVTKGGWVNWFECISIVKLA